MDVETKSFVRPRLNADELWQLYRLIDGQYWLLRRHPHPLWSLEKVSRLRRKLLRSVNKFRESKYEISVRERVY